MFGTDPVEQIREALEALAGEERAGWPAVALSARLVELAGLAERVEAEVVRCVGQWDAAKAWAEDGGLGPAGWLAQKTATTRAAAVGQVRMFRFAFRHSRVGDALRTGEVSAANVATMATWASRRANAFADDEGLLVEVAQRLRPDEFVAAMRHWRSIIDDEHPDPNPGFDRRYFRITDTLDGAKLDGFLDRSRRLGPRRVEQDRQARRQRWARRPTHGGQRWADALCELARESLGRTTRGGAYVAHIDAVLDVNRLLHPEAPIDLYGDGHTIGGVSVSSATIERLCWDSHIGRVIMAGCSEVLDVGRQTRVPNRAQRRALIRRARHCQFPCCDRPPEWTDAHHLQHWLHGGSTDLDNLVLLCRRHHVLCHEGRWHLTRAPNGQITSTKPSLTNTPPRRGPPLTLAA